MCLSDKKHTNVASMALSCLRELEKLPKLLLTCGSLIDRNILYQFATAALFGSAKELHRSSF